MNSLAWTPVIAAILAALGWPFTTALRGRGMHRVIYASAVAGLVGVFAATLTVGFVTNFVAMYAMTWAIAFAGVFAASKRRSPEAASTSARPSFDRVPLLLTAVGGIVAMLPVVRAPIAFDARSIWWIHADWLRHGGSVYVGAIHNRMLADGLHVDYPQFLSGQVALVWSATRHGRDLVIGQATTTVSTLFAVLMMVDALIDRLRLSTRAAGLLGVGFLFATYGMVGTFATNGYADLLWSAFAVTAALRLLRFEQPLDWLGLAALAAAATTKSEGLTTAMLIAVVVGWSRSWSQRVLLMSALVPAAAWFVVARLRGAENDIVGGLRDVTVHSLRGRLWPPVPAIAGLCWPYIAVLCIVIGLRWNWFQTQHDRLPTMLGPLMVVALGATVMLWAVYLVSPHDVYWHLKYSVDRTTFSLRLFLLVGAVLVAFDEGTRSSPVVVELRSVDGEVIR